MGQEISIQAGGAVSPKLSIPRGIASALADNRFSLTEWTTATALERMDRSDRQRVPGLAQQAEATLRPADREWLSDRLSTLWMFMSNERDPDRTTTWLHESMRLLDDLPQDIVSPAIDEAVKKSERGFLPSIGAIRAIADPMLEDRRQKVRRLRMLADAILAPEMPKLEREPFKPCSPEDAAEIMAENGISRMEATKPRCIDPTRLRGPKAITVEDYVSLGLTREAAERAIAEFQGRTA
ncbi:hypothetical protein [Sphingobium indicum]|uniref:Uncharacterized protein n=1 Tax=Sphingobium indicum (strain DSM 16412 / CCM 7286 / MTCC 6364 / B90A) TaxID=861109 RepID=A0A1L5BMC5_SPHIB|nr:hypothetical protein [Sphingobium indicum]APL94100.1 hypothetical protein SIDU_06040 [Sphingobium indicum B90A]